MIISASYRTDIPAFYGRWFLNRLAAGHCRVANPWNRVETTVSLAKGDVDGFVFWTRNLEPFLACLDATQIIAPFYIQHTTTGYPRVLETRVVAEERAIASMRSAAARFGPSSVVWRYDPVLITDLTPPKWHIATFQRLAAALESSVDEVVVSAAHIYAKTRRNLDRAAAEHGFSWRDPEAEEKTALFAQMAEIAAGHGMALTLCSQPEYAPAGVLPARCIDVDRLSDIAERPIRAAVKGNRPGCACHVSRDIGAYDTCPHGCVYCYAVRDNAAARRRHRAHNPDAALLDDPTPGTDPR